MTSSPRCVACAGPLRLFGPHAGYTYFSCRGCRSIQLYPMPDAATLEAAYRREYAEGAQVERYVDPEWSRAATRPYGAGILKALLDHRIKGTAIDVGAGWGGLVEMMLKAGLDARGVELSEQQVEYAKHRSWPIVQGDLGTLENLDGLVSAVTLCAVFEHLTDHARVLGDARRLLRDDGLLITLHPTAPFCHLIGNIIRLGIRSRELPSFAGAFAAPWHTLMASIEGTRLILKKNGFEIVEIRRASQGRFGGIIGLLQRMLNLANDVGWPIFGTRWPLVAAHIFVCRKIVT